MVVKKPSLELTPEDREILDELHFWFGFKARFGWVFKILCMSMLGGLGWMMLRVGKESLLLILKT